MREKISRGDSPDASDGHSWHRMVWRRFVRHRLAVIGLSTLAVLVSVAVFAPRVAPHPPEEVRLDRLLDGRPQPPSWDHPFGTDALGRDYLSRAIFGGRISLSVGVVAMAISITIGTVLGSLAGFYGGLADTIICRFIDVMLAVPVFFLILIVNAMLTPNIFNVMVVIGVFGWMGCARLVRGEFLRLRNMDFVDAARALGNVDNRIIFRHILPNALAPVIVAATLGTASAILTESGLSYLGMGVQEPTPSWGSMLRAAQPYLTSAPWLAFFPGLLIMISVLSLNFVGDALRDALDPKTMRQGG